MMTRHETIAHGALHRRGIELAGARVHWLLGEKDTPDPDLDAGLASLRSIGTVGIGELFERFGLAGVARDVFLLAAAPELGPVAAAAVAEHPLSLRGRATPALVELVLETRGVEALGAASHLRVAALVDLSSDAGFSQRLLSVDAAVACYLRGMRQPSEALLPALVPLSETSAGGEHIAHAIRDARNYNPQPLIHLRVEQRREAEMQAAGAFAALGLATFALEPDQIDVPPGRIAALVNRDMVFLDAAVLLASGPATDVLADKITAPLIMWGKTTPNCRRPVAQVGGIALSRHSELPDGAAVSATDLQDAQASRQMGFAPSLWFTLRGRAAAGLDYLAHRIEPQARWEDLILPEAQLDQLRQMAAFRRNAATVLVDWGFRDKSVRGLGLAALFSGPSGTGKTMAAEIVAAELGPDSDPLELYRVDLSAVVSKYIGETEKNIGRVFDAAEGAGAVLIFDEGEALFGKRTSDVKDSHDRHANTETAYLLQRLESYTGCAIVTTNLKDTVDEAFLRRFRMVVDFPFPNAELRADIWQSVFPDETPTKDLDFRALSRLAITGGFIRSIALTAAFLAAENGVPVAMHHIEKAARQEYGKLGKPLSESELRGFR